MCHFCGFVIVMVACSLLNQLPPIALQLKSLVLILFISSLCAFSKRKKERKKINLSNPPICSIILTEEVFAPLPCGMCILTGVFGENVLSLSKAVGLRLHILNELFVNVSS